MTIFPRRASLMLWFIFPIPLLSSFFLFLNNKILFVSWYLFSVRSIDISVPIILDPYGILFSSTVIFIRANVIIFSSSYMFGDLFMQRFIYLVLLFVLSINLLIFVPHLICLLIGWDGLGIVSFVLVIYYQNPKRLAAGIITALINRVGDVIILVSIALCINLGHWNTLFFWTTPSSWLIVLFLTVAAITKSAQVPFSSWLPAAIAAPTPVSALVHSSTLVTAGIFILFRFDYFFSLYPYYNQFLLIIATITIFIAGTSALAECDIKKIIALSTLSQLGVIMSRLAIHLPTLAFFHLLTHALFKALLFLTAGSIIHFHHHSQDLRFIGDLPLCSPLSLSCLSIANLALCGRPFLAGFYSKDLILESLFYGPFNIAIIVLFFIATGITARYSIRFILSTLWISPLATPACYIYDSDSFLTSPIIFLASGAIVGGASLSWLAFFRIEDPVLPKSLKLLAFLVTLMGGAVAFYITIQFNLIWESISKFHFLCASIWCLVPSLSQGIIKTPFKWSFELIKSLDQGWIEFVGPKGIFVSSSSSSLFISSSQSNISTAHLSIILIFVSTLLLILCPSSLFKTLLWKGKDGLWPFDNTPFNL